MTNWLSKRRRVVITLIGLACLSAGWLALAQDNSAPPEWKVGVWKSLQLSKGQKARFKDKFVSAPLAVTISKPESGKIAFATDDLSYGNSNRNSTNSTSAKKNQIVTFNLTDVTTDGFSSTLYVAKAERPGPHVSGYPYNVNGPQFSPSGDYILLKFRSDYSAYFPIILNVRKGDFRGLTCIDEEGLFTPGATEMALWSPDNYHIAYFEPQPDEHNETVDELASADALRTVYVQDWRSNTRFLAVKAQGVTHPLSWRNSRTLLYGALPRERKQRFDLYDILVAGKLPRPNIYSYSTQSRQTTLLIRDGFRPTASPDGSLIAFYGSRDPKQPQPLRFEEDSPLWLWRYFCNGASLCVAKADGTGRIAFQPYAGLYPLIQWLPDNKRFVTIERTKAGPNFEAQVTLWNVETQSFKKLTTLQATDAEKPLPNEPYASIAFPFDPKGASPDGKKVFVTSTSYKRAGVIESAYRPSTEVLQSIDVETGAVSTIAKIENAAGMDWIPTASPSSP